MSGSAGQQYGAAVRSLRCTKNEGRIPILSEKEEGGRNKGATYIWVIAPRHHTAARHSHSSTTIFHSSETQQRSNCVNLCPLVNRVFTDISVGCPLIINTQLHPSLGSSVCIEAGTGLLPWSTSTQLQNLFSVVSGMYFDNTGECLWFLCLWICNGYGLW